MRTVLLGAAIAGLMLDQVWAQADHPPPQCQQLLAMRDEVQKHGQAINDANKRKADVRIACRLFRSYLAAEAKMLKAMDTNGPECGVPAQINEQVRVGHTKASQIGQQVCDAAGPTPREQGDFWTPAEWERFQSPMPFD